jgi:hypothetical protein
MAESVLKHVDDDGTVSVFASGNVIVLSCDRGHHWVVEAEQQTSETVKSRLDTMIRADQAEELYKLL